MLAYYAREVFINCYDSSQSVDDKQDLCPPSCQGLLTLLECPLLLYKLLSKLLPKLFPNWCPKRAVRDMRRVIY